MTRSGRPCAENNTRVGPSPACASPSLSSATEAAIAEADEMLEIFSALLRIAQIEAGAQKSAFATVDISELARSVGEAYLPAAEDSQHRLVLEVQDGVTFNGDRQLLAQMLSNLIENALHHTPDGTIVTVTVRKPAGKLEIEVADTGPGIPQAERDKVFERFYRLDRSRGTRRQSRIGEPPPKQGVGIEQQPHQAWGGKTLAFSISSSSAGVKHGAMMSSYESFRSFHRPGCRQFEAVKRRENAGHNVADERVVACHGAVAESDEGATVTDRSCEG